MLPFIRIKFNYFGFFIKNELDLQYILYIYIKNQFD